jgi:hypothetical protein
MSQPTGAATPSMQGARTSTFSTLRIGIGLLTTLSGLAAFIATFLPWITVGGDSTTGWDLAMAKGPGNAAWRTGFSEVGGLIIFTGYWSIVVGALLLALGIGFLVSGRQPGALRRLGGFAVIMGTIGAATAAVNMVMTTSNLREAVVDPVSAGVGLTVFLIASVAGLVLGIIALSIGGKR